MGLWYSALWMNQNVSNEYLILHIWFLPNFVIVKSGAKDIRTSSFPHLKGSHFLLSLFLETP